MDDIIGIENIFPSWKVKKIIGSGSYGKVYELERVEDDAVYRSAMKIIAIPQNDSEIRSRLAEGESRESVKAYYDDVTRNLLNENRVMAELKGNSNIVSYEDHQVVKHEDGIGSDIFIRMELLTSFIDYMAENRIDEDTVIRLGLDMCKALEICERRNLIHRDIKPGNIFVSDTGDFKLGDFGIARTIDMTSGGLSKKGTYRYMAPEVYKGDVYGRTVDICSLGLVMYYLMNDNRTPFLPDAPASITYNDEESALVKRMNGEAIPAPRHASEALTSIILRACSYDPQDRYQSATQMREDLEALRSGTFSQTGTGRSGAKARTGGTARPGTARPAAAAAGSQGSAPARTRHAGGRNNRQLLIIGGAAAAAIIIGLLVFLLVNVLSDRSGTEPVANDETATTQAETEATEPVATEDPREHVYAHRTGEGEDRDRNVIAQYDNFIEQGAEYIEQDVFYVDGDLYISLRETSDGRTRLRDVFDRYGREVYYLIEIKEAGYAYPTATINAFVDLVEKYDFQDQVMVQCFNTDVLDDVKSAMPSIKGTIALIDQTHETRDGYTFALALKDPNVDEISVKYGEGYMTEGNCNRVHNADKRFSAWTLSDNEQILEAIQMGLDSYFTTMPAVAINLEKKNR